MSKKTQIIWAVGLAAVALVGLVAVPYLALVFPKTVAVWAAQGRALSAADRLLVEASQFCKQFGIFFIPLFLAGIIGGGVWAGIAALDRQPKNENG